MKFSIDLVVGARPNFMKAAPLSHMLNKYPGDIAVRLVHTGQHYDENMSQIFFEDLGMPEPDVYLEVGSGSHAKQTGDIMVAYEELLREDLPDLVLVVGDVNSTVAAALVAKKLGTQLGHIEAGLRSLDRRMPEEINRIATDSISDHLFTTSRGANENLRQEGHAVEEIHFVGNLMIDSLNSFIDRADCSALLREREVQAGRYGLITLHRPSNVDDKAIFTGILQAFKQIQEELPLIFPAHPRTRNRLEEFGLLADVENHPNFHLLEPVGYLEFIALQRDAQIIFTDSGGIQEESTVLGVPCLTIRENTERPVTITEGTNRLIGSDPRAIVEAVEETLSGDLTEGKIPEKWDGKTAERILSVLWEINPHRNTLSSRPGGIP